MYITDFCDDKYQLYLNSAECWIASIAVLIKQGWKNLGFFRPKSF